MTKELLRFFSDNPASTRFSGWPRQGIQSDLQPVPTNYRTYCIQIHAQENDALIVEDTFDCLVYIIQDNLLQRHWTSAVLCLLDMSFVHVPFTSMDCWKLHASCCRARGMTFNALHTFHEKTKQTLWYLFCTWNCNFVGLLQHSYWPQLVCLAKDHWLGFSTRNAHMVSIIN